MLVRLQKALFALILALSFILNGGAMQAAHASKPVPSPAMNMAHGASPSGHAKHAGKSHPCCPHQSQHKASCTADCCTSVIPVTLQASTEFTFIHYKPRPKPALALASRITGPPSRPPKV
jgi:hypothetical protein